MRPPFKRAFVSGALLAAAMICGGCGAQQVTPQQADVVSSDSVIATFEADAAAAIGSDLPTVSALAGSPLVDAVVEGKIEAVDYIMAGGRLPMTRLTVSVSRARGVSDATVTVWESGGLIKVSDLPERSRQKALGSESSAPPADAVVDFRPDHGATRAAVGDAVVLFLHKEPSTTGPQAGGYLLVAGTLGRFTFDSESQQYVRSGDEQGWERSLAPNFVDRELTAR